MYKEKEWSDNYKIHLSGFTLDAAERYKKKCKWDNFFPKSKMSMRLKNKQKACNLLKK